MVAEREHNSNNNNIFESTTQHQLSNVTYN